MWITQSNEMWPRNLTLFIGRRKALTVQAAISSNLTEISQGGTTSTELRSSSWNYHPPSLPIVISRENLPTTPLVPYISSSNPNPTPRTIFPLPCDHLLTLIQYNVLRATLSNMALLSLLHCIPQECGGAMNMPILPTPTDIPPSLAPVRPFLPFISQYFKSRAPETCLQSPSAPRLLIHL